MIGFRVSHDTLLEQVVPLAATKSEGFRLGFHHIIALYNSTAAQVLAQAYGLPDANGVNNNQQRRIDLAEQFLMEDTEKLEGFLFGWLTCVGHREDFVQVVEGESAVPRPASLLLRQAMFRFLNEGKL